MVDKLAGCTACVNTPRSDPSVAVQPADSHVVVFNTVEAAHSFWCVQSLGRSLCVWGGGGQLVLSALSVIIRLCDMCFILQLSAAAIIRCSVDSDSFGAQIRLVFFDRAALHQ